MDATICNIQVLLRAAEFLERRERGSCFLFVYDKCQVCRWGSSSSSKQQNTQWSEYNYICRTIQYCAITINCVRNRRENTIKVVLVGPSHLTQWPTYRLHHCTRRRQSGLSSNWIAAALSAQPAEPKLLSYFFPFRDSFIANSVDTRLFFWKRKEKNVRQ